MPDCSLGHYTQTDRPVFIVHLRIEHTRSAIEMDQTRCPLPNLTHSACGVSPVEQIVAFQLC